MRRSGPWVCALLSGAAAAMLAGPALAGLGAGAASLDIDRAHFAAHMRTAPAATYTETTLTLPNGGVAKEFSRADGTVFAVTWQGPSRPDLRQLLGVHFETFQADATAVDHRIVRRRPLDSNRTDLVVHSGGRSGSFWGFAYLPPLIPAGFSARDLH
jgi:hypothetical protein